MKIIFLFFVMFSWRNFAEAGSLRYTWKENGVVKEAYLIPDQTVVFDEGVNPSAKMRHGSAPPGVNTQRRGAARSDRPEEIPWGYGVHLLKTNTSGGKRALQASGVVEDKKSYLVFADSAKGAPARVLREGLVLEFKKDFPLEKREEIFRLFALEVKKTVFLLNSDFYYVEGSEDLQVFKKISDLSVHEGVNSAMPNWWTPRQLK